MYANADAEPDDYTDRLSFAVRFIFTGTVRFTEADYRAMRRLDLLAA